MLTRLARLAVARRRAVLLAAAAFLIVAGAVGGGVVDKLSVGGRDDRSSEQFRAAQILEQEFGTPNPHFVLLVTARGGVDDPAAAEQGARLTQALASESGVVTARSYWSVPGRPPSLRSDDGRRALVLAQLTGDEDERLAAAARLSAEYSGARGSLDVRPGGTYTVFHEIREQLREDMGKAEMVAFPLTLVLLVAVFGGVVAAALPLALGAVAVVGTLVVLQAVSAVAEVSVYALNMTTALGLGLAIDYSLFVLARYREEVRRGRDRQDAVIASVTTAGRSVLFSAAAVALSLAALLVFPLPALRSFAYAGVAVVLLAAASALVVLPAALAVLGRRVDALTLWTPRTALDSDGFWARMARRVMRRPLVSAAAVIVLLLALGAPFARAQFSLPDDRVLPRSANAHQVHEVIRNEFPLRGAQTLFVVAPDASPDAGGVSRYASELSSVDGVAVVDAATGSYQDGQLLVPATRHHRAFADDDGTGTWFAGVPAVEPYSDAGRRVVSDVRSIDAPFDVLVGGPAASLVDNQGAIAERLPLALAWIAVATFVLLFLFTGGLLVPVKALVVNLLSLTATFGALVWVFQEGHLSWLVGNPTVTGALDTMTPVLMFCIAFGLSMDYEVFLLSRIREEWVATGDNTHAVAVGLQKTGRLVTSAAALMAVVFLAFATSGVTFAKMMGLGLALAVLVDATLVRGVLVPAFMRLAGRANWWAPGLLRRAHNRIALSDEPSSAARPAEPWLAH